MTPHRFATHRRSQGFSLVELMISLVIGMVVIGAVLAAYLGSGFSSRNSQAMSQMTEDASVALNVLRAQISMVGYSQPTGVNSSGFTRAYNGVGLVGCDDMQFADLALGIDALTCVASAGSSDSIAIAYEADAFNSAVSSTGAPLDCLGNALSLPSGITYYLSYSRFYLDQPEGATAQSLYCRGPGNASAQALVENVADLQVTYGVAAAPVPGQNRRVAYYAKASDLNAAQFAAVMAVKVCVLVASASEVMDTKTPYQPCDPFDNQVTPTDRRMYRAFSSTIVMHNRSGVLITTAPAP